MILKSLYSLIFLFALCVSGQELPPIQNYTPIEYNAGNQNWSIAQSNEQTMYVANNNGLLEFNGNTWNLYQVPYGTPVKSVMVLNERVFTGSYMQFGYWVRNEFGVLIYTSISDQLKTPLIEDEDFWNISHFKDWVLFQSLDRIYIYNIKKATFEILDAKSNSPKIFELGNKIFFQKLGEGLFTLENGEPILVSDDLILKQTNVVGAFLADNRILIITEQAEFFYLENNILVEWKLPVETDLYLSKIYSAIRLNDGSYVLGTISKGIFQLDVNGNIIRNINQEKGLNNNTVLSLFQDIDNNLWLGLDNGVSVINLDSPFKEYIDHVGALGVVYTANKKGDFLYLGTNQGLFYKKYQEGNAFKLIKGTQGQVWLLKEINGTLFCGHHNGTFVISDDTATKISEVSGTWDIQSIENKQELLIQGNYKGLSVLEQIGDKWQYRNSIDGFDSSSRFFEFVGENHLLVNHDYKGIFDLQINPEYKRVVKLNSRESKGNGSSLVRFKGDILYSTINGVFKYNINQHEFLIDSVLTSKFFNADERIIGILQATNNFERLWGFTNDNIITVSNGYLSKEPQTVKISIPNFFRRSMGILGFESIVHIDKDLYLIGISNGYVTLDLSEVKQSDYQIMINSVSGKSNEVPKIDISLQDNQELEYSENNVSFSYNVTEYDRYTEVYYQNKLKGLNEEWSTWSLIPNTSFDNLPYGSYEFKVRSKVGNSMSINTAVYSFKILRPWYASYWAILCYVILAALISFLIHRNYKNYYKKQQNQLIKANNKRLKRKKLKNQKKIVQIKNDQLQELVDSKNRELAISTMSIIKKNEFLSAIKDQLKSSTDNPKVKSVIKTIDRNINNEDDWKFFESAFNNADKDFLKKVKEKHSELSANDLRLCAYLRLNLSSKEIAPLLNISVRSVEVKRYRLRKKMKLPRETGLTDYIISL
ncbi:two-component regulator propeller domain-containing protein [uncultured Maribacter sp.]|uniref:helix-turn-helix and ligand-binding sensor domain-containing protein n=1 Tax=uncultured Maribacter sp. TaxID=431308 RepID=UPI0026249101|nr:two-component regulator propeller domain-containing protein [uncultured Maribacter sp.]